MQICDCSTICCDCTGFDTILKPLEIVIGTRNIRKVFEWGPGSSTRFCLSRGCEVFSIETNPKYLADLDLDYTSLTVLLTTKNSKNYLSLHGQKDVDLFVVDGRNRAACLDFIREQIEAPTVLLHDAQRHRYQEAIHRYSIITELNSGTLLLET